MGVLYIFPQFTCVENTHREDGKDLQRIKFNIGRFWKNFPRLFEIQSEL